MNNMNNYVSFISDEDFERCVSNLYDSYIAAHKAINESKVYDNKLDVIKLTFDKHFKNQTDEELLESEVVRQIDKSITNAIGTFHEEMLGSIEGYVRGNLDGWDIKSKNDNSLFADIKNKHNTMNSTATEGLYQKLQRLAKENPKAKCYWVQVISTKSFDEQWHETFGTKKGTPRSYNHPRVRKISGDKFYALLSGKDDALCQIYKVLPTVIDAVLKKRGITQSLQSQVSAITTITDKATTAKRSLLNQLAVDNLSYYDGFDKL